MEDEEFERVKHELHGMFRRIRRGHIMPTNRLGDLTYGESAVIMAIAKTARHDMPARPGVVAHMVEVTPSALSQMLKSLEGKGYLLRERLGDDSRGVALRLTDAGRLLAAEGERLRNAFLNDLFAYLGEDDVRDLVRVVRRMTAYFDERMQAPLSACADDAAASEQPAASKQSLVSGPPTASEPLPASSSAKGGAIPCA